MGRRRWCLLWVVITLGLGGCVAPPPSQAIPAPPSPPELTLLVGRASWYGGAHHGRLTASGERFDMNALTAAHRTLPFGTRLRVVNLNNSRAVEVRVNDRGPVVPGRMLDLSYEAARTLDAVPRGVIPVRITILPPR